MRNSTHATGSVVTLTLSRQYKPHGAKLNTRYGGSVVTLLWGLSRHPNTQSSIQTSRCETQHTLRGLSRPPATGAQSSP
jgi:hypothetical protein